MNSLPFGQLKSFLKILIGVQYENARTVRNSLLLGVCNDFQQPIPYRSKKFSAKREIIMYGNPE